MQTQEDWVLFLLGVLAFSQIVFFPGIIVLKFLPTRWRVIPTLVFTFALSLLINYVLVLSLTTLRLYTRAVIYPIFVIELILFVYLYRQTLAEPIGAIASKWLNTLVALANAFLKSSEEKKQSDPLSRFIILAATIGIAGYALSNLAWAARIWWNGVGAVIDRWDAVVSWNSWAMEWAANQFPAGTWEYPQLIPANLSISYVFLGNHQIQFFNTAFLSMFLFFILLLLFDLALQHKRFGFFLSVIAAKFILKEFTWEFFNTAYVDIPLAFFAFAAVFSILEARNQPDDAKRKGYIWIGFLLTAAASLTKQGGLFLLVLTPLMIWYVVLPAIGTRPSRRAVAELLWQPLGLALLIILPWYIYVEIGIIQGSMTSNIEWVASGIHGNLTYLQRFVKAFRSLGSYGYFLLLTILGGFWLQKEYRWVVYGIVMPYYLIWAFFFSYDARNLSLIFPFWGLATGLIAEKILVAVVGVIRWLKLGNLRLAILPVFWVALVIMGSFLLPDSKLISRQNELQKHILDDRLNTFLYEYFDELGRVEPILTDYPLRYLPGLQEVKTTFSDAEFFNQKWDRYPEVNYILMPNSAQKELKAQIFEKVENGEYELIFHEKNFDYYFIRRLTP